MKREDFKYLDRDYEMPLPRLALVQTDEFPADLDELIEWEGDSNRTAGCIRRWQLFILGENCD